MKSENRNSEGTLRLGTTHLHYMGILLYLLKRTAIAVPAYSESGSGRSNTGVYTTSCHAHFKCP
jgi:hypothetical protein